MKEGAAAGPGRSPEFGPVRWFTFGRSGAHTITLGPGEDLTFDLDTPAGSSEPDFFGAELRLDAGEGNLHVLRVPLPPVDPIVVPRELLPDSESGEILARLVVTQHRSHVPEDEAYVVTPVWGPRSIGGWWCSRPDEGAKPHLLRG